MKVKLTPAQAIAVACPFCRRKPGQYCVTRGLGLRYEPAHYVHAARRRRAAVRLRAKAVLA